MSSLKRDGDRMMGHHGTALTGYHIRLRPCPMAASQPPQRIDKKRRSRKELPTTSTLDRLMAPAANIGFISTPQKG